MTTSLPLLTHGNHAMPIRLRRMALGVLLVVLSAAASSQATSKPIGFSLDISADGFLNPTIVKAVVSSISPGSQAKAAGLAVGDELVRVQGITVPGGSASVLKPLMEFVVGQPKKLSLRRGDGTEYEATLTREPLQ